MTPTPSVTRSRELRLYEFYTKLIRKLLLDTEYILNEMNNASCFNTDTLSSSIIGSHSMRLSDDHLHDTQSYEWGSSDHLTRVKTEISEEDKEKIQSIFIHPFTITILSQDPRHRTKVLTELLGQDILDLPSNYDTSILWQSFLIRSGYKSRIVKLNTDFAVSSPTTESLKRKNSSPFRGKLSAGDIFVQTQNTPSPVSKKTFPAKNSFSYLEVYLNNLPISYSLNVYIPEIRDVRNLERMFKAFHLNSNRIFIHPLSSNHLSMQDMELIKYLKALYSSISIFFIIYNHPPTPPPPLHKNNNNFINKIYNNDHNGLLNNNNINKNFDFLINKNNNNNNNNNNKGLSHKNENNNNVYGLFNNNNNNDNDNLLFGDNTDEDDKLFNNNNNKKINTKNKMEFYTNKTNNTDTINNTDATDNNTTNNNMKSGRLTKINTECNDDMDVKENNSNNFTTNNRDNNNTDDNTNNHTNNTNNHTNNKRENNTNINEQTIEEQLFSLNFTLCSLLYENAEDNQNLSASDSGTFEMSSSKSSKNTHLSNHPSPNSSSQPSTHPSSSSQPSSSSLSYSSSSSFSSSSSRYIPPSPSSHPMCGYEILYEPDEVTLASSLNEFVKLNCRRNVLETVETLSHIHLTCLDTTINLAYTMAKDGTHVPPRINFARVKEEELYRNLMEMAVKNQDAMKNMMMKTIEQEKDPLIQEAASCEINDVDLSEDSFIKSTKDLKSCSDQIEEFVLTRLNSFISTQLVESIDVLRDSYTGILSRCLASLEQPDVDGALNDNSKTSRALKDIMDAAYHVNINVQANDSVLRNFIEKMKKLFNTMLWRSPLKVDADWKRKIASDMLATLNHNKCHKLARGLCNQINERLRKSHQQFESSLKQLELKLGGRLEKMEEQRLRIRKEFAPRVAKLSLESRSLKDLVRYGKPHLGKLLGNGQYGVVFRCEKWGKIGGPLAVKTLVPHDEKHWNDLAMEFYHTRNIPDHERVIRLRGSVVDYNYSSGPAVLLVMDMMKMDLYMAIERNLGWIERLQVTIDIVEGIRFLHSQGLVHRDIKLKNILLDDKNRGKLTDLGFCKPETLMTGSVVGSPIHMAPELVTGKYDHSIDVYAFGVLFWYVCSGSVVLPAPFQKCSNKDKLWIAVKKGVRPEKPKDVDPECWQLMLRCWHSDSKKRPIVGEIELILRSIYNRFTGRDNVDEAAGDGNAGVEGSLGDSSGLLNTNETSSLKMKKKGNKSSPASLQDTLLKDNKNNNNKDGCYDGSDDNETFSNDIKSESSYSTITNTTHAQNDNNINDNISINNKSANKESINFVNGNDNKKNNNNNDNEEDGVDDDDDSLISDDEERFSYPTYGVEDEDDENDDDKDVDSGDDDDEFVFLDGSGDYDNERGEENVRCTNNIIKKSNNNKYNFNNKENESGKNNDNDDDEIDLNLTLK